MLHRIVYVSRRSEVMTDRAVAQLCASSSSKNRLASVTGILLAGPTWFLQQLEGARDDVETIFGRIERDSRHREVRVVVSEALPYRMFGEWDMRLASGDDFDGLLPESIGDPVKLPEPPLLAALARLAEMVKIEREGIG